MMEVLSTVIRAQFHPAKPCILSRTALTNRDCSGSCSGTTSSPQWPRLTCKQTILMALFELEVNNIVDLAKLKQAEDEILGIVGKWPKWKQAIAYRYLYNLEIRISDVDRIIQEGLGKERE